MTQCHPGFSHKCLPVQLQLENRYISKKFNIMKNQYFLSLISESETHILYRFITQSEIFQALFLDILMIMAYR